MARYAFALALMLLWPSAGAMVHTDGGDDSEPAMGRREAFANTTLIEKRPGEPCVLADGSPTAQGSLV